MGNLQKPDFLTSVPDANDPQWKDNLVQAVNFLLHVEDFHEVGSANEPDFKNSWANFGGTHGTLGFYLDPFGRVNFKGSVASGVVGAGTPVFTLKLKYRPPRDVHIATMDWLNSAAHIHISAGTGDVSVINGDNRQISFDSLSFRL